MNLFTEVRARVSLPEGLELLDQRATRNTFRCIRPDHTDTSPSASIYRRGDTEKWWCFVCQAGGDVIDLIAQAHGMPVLEAARFLARAYGIRAPQTTEHLFAKAKPKPPRPYDGTYWEPQQARWGAERTAATFECRLPKCPPGKTGLYDYLEADLALLRVTWRDRQHRGLYTSEFWKVRQIRNWYAWALSLLTSSGPTSGKPPRKKRRRALAFH